MFFNALSRNTMQRMELKPFGVQVVEVVTGTIRSSFGVNALKESQLPDGSKYSCLQPFIDKVSRTLS